MGLTVVCDDCGGRERSTEKFRLATVRVGDGSEPVWLHSDPCYRAALLQGPEYMLELAVRAREAFRP